MASFVGLAIHPGLAATTRLRGVASRGIAASTRDWLILISAGIAAACASILIEMRLQTPGSAILKVVLPMAMGLALVPRHGAGCVMGAAAALTAGGLKWGGFGGDGLSAGAMTSLIATGPLLDLALHRVSGGWRLYAAFAAAGLASNLLAFIVRGAAKAFLQGSEVFLMWLPRAAVTHVLCGLAAGLISAVIFFYARRKSLSEEST